MNELMLNFNYTGISVRTICIEDIAWFVLKDVCDILGIKNSRNVFNRLEEDEKGVHFVDTPGGQQEMQIINEFGLYDTILRSNSDRAKSFRRWVTHEVIPSIRKQGYYSMFSKEKTLDIIVNQISEDLSLASNMPFDKRPCFVDSLDKRKLKAQGIQLLRSKKHTEIQQLWISDFNECNPTDFMHKLQKICNGDSGLFHKYWDLYNQQKNPKFRGVVTI